MNHLLGKRLLDLALFLPTPSYGETLFDSMNLKGYLRIASASFDRTVQIWDATSGSNIYQTYLHLAGGLAWSPDGTCIACGTYDEIVEVLQTV